MNKNTRQVQLITGEQVLLKALMRAYRDSAIDIVAASSHLQAIAQLDTFGFDLIIFDLDTDRSNGFELLQMISARCAGTPIILLTTMDTQAPELQKQIKKARPFGCWHILEKPFSISKLNSYIGLSLVTRTFEQTADVLNQLPEQADRRACKRVPRNEKITLRLAGGDHHPFFSATLSDISISGMGLTTDVPLARDQRVTFEEKFMHASGVVVWSYGKDSRCMVGVRFT
ncbi:response regulator [Pelovirga terrestris]|uniref:Response regulator n=1 Tax=Pelovirga terrestris TaxID=2771352 RepID=A0A8J6QV18_9BACT|nr:response regulator [Pelovirga terrestris]MBD1401105.1 response regulator [Pelovirga terrestris]